MKFMVITKATADSEAGVMPSTENFETMGAFIQELVDAGVLLAAEGLLPSSTGVRIYIDEEDERTVVEGPFAETTELVAGFFLVDVPSLAACVVLFSRCPIPRTTDGSRTHLEIRPLPRPEDFGEAFTAEQQEAVERRRATVAAQQG